jgi:RNA polymerase sigma factor (sigma-70 family)
MTDSQRLLAEYAQTGSEAAFQELVSRYINFVYSTALRLVGGDAHLAKDVAQTVFIGLASRGRALSTEVMLGGWLHQHTFHVATKAVRTERRRQSREREAVEMNELHENLESSLRQIAPLLDEAITQLESEDRTAILLRFFEQRNFRSVGEALGTNEDAARMRVNRALEKLHVLLKRRGVTLSVAAFGIALTTGAVTAAPAGLAATISSIALASTAAGTGTMLAILKVMTKTKLKLALTTLVIAGAATTLVIQHQLQKTLREKNESLRQQITQLKADNESLSSLAAQSNNPASLPSDQFNELLRLRGQVGVLRAQITDFARLRQENQNLLSKLAAQSDPTNQLSTDDKFTLQQTHAVDALTLLLNAIKSYTTNHNGSYPESLEQLTASGDLGTTNFAGNLGLGDFQLINDGTVDHQGYRVILSIRAPIQRPGKQSVMVEGALNDAGLAQTEIWPINSE